MKMSGAVAAVREGGDDGVLFDGYDWIVRANPDVLLRDDAFLRENTKSDDVDALLINCHHNIVGGDGVPLDVTHVQTDFFAVRPEVF